MQSVFLYFGSFNPPHIGHLAIAHYVVTENLADELWYVVSPQNPMKSGSELAPAQDRLAMVECAIADMDMGDRVKVCDIELTLPTPSYTYNTLKELSARYPDTKFSILMGEDNYISLPRWYRSSEIRECYDVVVYPRNGVGVATELEGVRVLEDVATFNISSSKIRSYIYIGVNIAIFTTNGVVSYIKTRGLYGVTNEVAQLMESAKSYHKMGDKQCAINDLLQVLRLDPDNSEATAYLEMLQGIFDFRHIEIYNA